MRDKVCGIMKKRILVVDDNPEILFSIKHGLEEKYDEYIIFGADGGRRCFEFLKNEEKPDVILLDIMMPEMNGWDVYARLQENEEWKNIPVVFLTAKTDDYSKGFGKLVCYDYIEKPFILDDLRIRIDEVMKTREKDSHDQ